jgi:hypothetical protein
MRRFKVSLALLPLRLRLAGIGLLALGLALWASVLSDRAFAEDARPPPPVETTQRYADYTKDQTVYHHHVFEEVALSIAFALVLTWAFGFELAMKLRGDLLPAKLRNALDRLDSARLAVRALALGTKSCRPESELGFEAQAYDEIAARANAALTKARGELIANAVDEAGLIPELEQLILGAAALSARLKALQPENLSAAEVGDRMRFGLGFANRIHRGWRRAFARPKRLKIVTIEQIHGMRWPAWSNIRGLPL